MAIVQSISTASSSPGFQTAVGYGVTSSPSSTASATAGFQQFASYGASKTVFSASAVAIVSSSVQAAPKSLVGQLFPKLR